MYQGASFICHPLCEYEAPFLKGNAYIGSFRGLDVLSGGLALIRFDVFILWLAALWISFFDQSELLIVGMFGNLRGFTVDSQRLKV